MTPPGCAVPSDDSPAVASAYGRAAADATTHTFSTSFVQAMRYQVVIYLLVLAFLFRLPKVNPRQLAELDDGARTATGG